MWDKLNAGAVAEMTRWATVATIDISRKEGGCCAPFAGGWGSWVPSNTMWPGLRSIRYQVASSSIQPFGYNSHGPKTGGWDPI